MISNFPFSQKKKDLGCRCSLPPLRFALVGRRRGDRTRRGLCRLSAIPVAMYGQMFKYTCIYYEFDAVVVALLLSCSVGRHRYDLAVPVPQEKSLQMP